MDMYQVVKRDGKVVDFDINKIAAAIKKAFEATNTDYNDSVIDFLALKVSADFLPKIKDGKVAVEDVQDSVEAVLSRGGYETVAKAYILYRKQREKLRNTKSSYLDYKETVDKYLNIEDWRVKENSTVTYSVGGLILSNSGAITANYWLSEVYDQEIANAHRNCDLHLHDLSMLTGYCAGWSLKQLIQQGLGIPGKINSAPASHLSTLCNQMVNFLGIMQNEWAGAQAFSSFDTYLAPFVKVDNLSYKEVKQCIQSFIFGVNTPSRWGTQAPFSNLTLDCKIRKGQYEKYMTVIKSYWAEIGVTLNLTVEDSGVWQSDWADGNLEVTALGWFPLYADADNHMYTYFYSANAKGKSSFYNNPKVDELLSAARVSQDKDERASLYKEADHIICHEDFATIPLFWPKNSFAAKSYVKNAKVGNLVYHMLDLDIDTSDPDYKTA